jgi:signal transduction histidine kinase
VITGRLASTLGWCAILFAGGLLIAAAMTGTGQLPAYLGLLGVSAANGIRVNGRHVAVAALAAVGLGTVAVLIDVRMGATQGAQSVVLLAVAPMICHAVGRSKRRSVELERLRSNRTLENGRAEVARDVHDITSHALMAVITQLRVADRALTVPDHSAAQRGVSAARDAASSALDELRTLAAVLSGSTSLTQPALTTGKLGQEFARLCSAVHEARFVAKEVRDDLQIDERVSTAALRIVQQCLANAATHAPGEIVTISLETSGDGVVISSSNRHPMGSVRRSGIGLAIMHRRATEAGGELIVEESEQRFTVRCVLPIGAA